MFSFSNIFNLFFDILFLMPEEGFRAKVFPIVLNQYLLKFREEERYARSVTIIFVISGVYGVVYFNLGIYKGQYQALSFIPLFLLYAYTLLYIAQVPSLWPWVHYPQLDQEVDSEQAFESFENQIFKLTGEMDKVIRASNRFIWLSCYLIILSFCWMLSIYQFATDLPTMIISMVLTTSIVPILLYQRYRKLLIQRLKKLAEINGTTLEQVQESFRKAGR